MAMRLGARKAPAADRSFGAFALSRLDWDSSHFGRKMGRLELRWDADTRAPTLAVDLRLALAEAADDGYEHVILRVPAENLHLARSAESAGLRLVDVAVDLVTANGSRSGGGHAVAGVRPSRPSDLECLRSIAESAFEFGRFATDPFFSAEAAAGFYRQWVTNLCDGLAKVVLVAEAADEIAGFTSCAVQPDGSGRIPLIATSDAHRRQGIGRSLIEASLRWFASVAIHRVWVRTQAANYAALALYYRSGFRVGVSDMTFAATLGHFPTA